MANIGPNQGRKLRPALNRFAAVLIEEAKDLIGCSYEQLDLLLDLPEGQAYRYSLYPRRKKTRSPQAGSIQQLENRVATLLKRHAHKVVIRNNTLVRQPGVEGADGIVGTPDEHPSLDDAEWWRLELAYEHDWPTYRRLKGRSVMHNFLWQWGILWDRGAIPFPWSRELFGIPSDMPVEHFLPSLTQAQVQWRLATARSIAAGILPETPSHEQLLAEARRYGFPC